MMSSEYVWQRHDQCIYGCGLQARWLKDKILDAQARLKLQDKADKNGARQDEILKKWETLKDWQQMAQRTESLCEWEQAVHMDVRTDSPFDTVPASRSRYAWALNIRSGTPVSPMRAVFHLEKKLERAMQLILDF
jgi:hypothetical protein